MTTHSHGYILTGDGRFIEKKCHSVSMEGNTKENHNKVVSLWR